MNRTHWTAIFHTLRRIKWMLCHFESRMSKRKKWWKVDWLQHPNAWCYMVIVVNWKPFLIMAWTDITPKNKLTEWIHLHFAAKHVVHVRAKKNTTQEAPQYTYIEPIDSWWDLGKQPASWAASELLRQNVGGDHRHVWFDTDDLPRRIATSCGWSLSGRYNSEISFCGHHIPAIWKAVEGYRSKDFTQVSQRWQLILISVYLLCTEANSLSI